MDQTTPKTPRDQLEATLEALLAIERRRNKDRSQDLDLTMEALAAAIELFQVPKANPAAPFKWLLAALHDLQCGARPELLFSRGPRPAGKPTNTISDATRGRLAAAADLLIQAGVPTQEAGRMIARRVASSHIPIAGLSLTESNYLAHLLPRHDAASLR
ncbi:MAG: hypothetical protein ABSC06_36250 [Rhodopila sp.]